MIKGGWQFVNSARSAGSSTGGDPWAPLDGRLAAPVGTPQFPTILNTYHPSGPADGRYRWPSNAAFNSSTGNYQQAQWEVAGVDYAVGVPTGTVLADPVPGFPTLGQSSLAVGLRGTANTFGDSSLGSSQTAVIQILDNNFTVDSYDFSLHNGISIEIGVGVQNLTIKNCKFKIGTNNVAFTCLIGAFSQTTDVAQNGMTIKYCELDGSASTLDGGTVGTATIEWNSAGNIVIEYNYVHDSFSEFMVCGVNSTMSPPASNITIRYNAFYNNAVGLKYPDGSGVHGDWWTLQSGSASYTVTSVDISWNFWYQDNWATEGVNPENGNTIQTLTMSNNTMIAKAGSFQATGSVNEFLGCDITSGGIQTCNVNNNFLDPRGLWTGNGPTDWFLPANPQGFSGFTGTGNVHMTDGTTSTFP